MPIEQTPQMSPEDVDRIIRMTNIKGNFLQSNPVHSQLVKEINLDYSRSLNKLMFDEEIGGSAGQIKYSSIELPQLEPESRVPYFGKYFTPEHKMMRMAQKNFAFASLLTKMEVVKTLSKVRVECDKLASTSIFIVNHTKIVKIEEFEQTQTSALQNVKGGLKDGWITVLKNIVKTGFKEVGKGWYNMMESNTEVYKISKLYKFMTAVKFMMQDSLRSMVVSSINEFLKSVKNITSQRVIINGTNDVRVFDLERSKELPKRPLFLIDLAFKAGKLQYNLDLEVFESIILGLFDRAITTPESLPQLEPLVLDQMFWATKPTLQIINSRETIIVKCRKELIASIRDGTAHLILYIAQFERHMKWLNMDIPTFAAEYESQEHTLEEMQADILRFSKEWEALDKDIPSHISLGLFWVNCEMVRTSMRKDLSKVILELVSVRASKITSSIVQGSLQIYNRLREKPTKIEELIDLRNYIEAIPSSLDSLDKQVKDMLEQHQVLDHHRFELSNEDMRARWTAYGWPAKLQELLVLTGTQMDTDENIFNKQLQTDQEIFKDRIHTLSATIVEFGKYGDLSRSPETVAEVMRVVSELKEVQSLSALFNSRERLFNLEPTKYDEVLQLGKDFEPYKILWLTINDWVKWKDQWMLGPFSNLNAEEVERNLLNSWRNVHKSVKFFKNQPGPLSVAGIIKNEMDEFKPYLPLIQALGNPGMRDRHWDRLSEELGINLHTDETFTLAGMLQMQLLERIDTISKVCDVAGKEYSIEEALDKMDTEWKTIELEIIAYKDTGTFIMKASEETVRLLDDHIVMAQSMGFSPYKKPFVDKITQWESKLRIVQEVLDSWMACQRSWLYLGTIIFILRTYF
jgi:dynein heavy chain